jgi:hypothetical protein
MVLKFTFLTDSGVADSNVSFDNIDSLLPYHNYIDKHTTVKIVNYMLDEISRGEKIFHDIYTDEEKHKQTIEEDTGQFFYRGEENAPFAVINAGGSFAYV